MIKFIILFLFLFPIVALGYTGNDLKSLCFSDSLDHEYGCFYFIMGVHQAHITFKNVDEIIPYYCVPNNASHGQIESIVKKYLQDNPSKLHLSASSLIINSLRESFSCN